jgi:DNA-directed RNA polymerase subunit K/omega
MINRSSLVMNTPQGANKYELAIVAAREARRLNNQLRMSGETEVSSAKVTTQALARSLKEEVAFHYIAGRTNAPEPAPALPTPTE